MSQQLIFIDGPYGCGKTTIIDSLRAIIATSGADAAVVDEEFLNDGSCLPPGAIRGVKWMADLVARGLRSRKQKIFFDGSPLAGVVYRKMSLGIGIADLFFQELEEMGYDVALLYLDIPAEQRWAQVTARLERAAPDELLQRNGLDESDRLHFDVIGALFTEGYNHVVSARPDMARHRYEVAEDLLAKCLIMLSN